MASVKLNDDVDPRRTTRSSMYVLSATDESSLEEPSSQNRIPRTTTWPLSSHHGLQSMNAGESEVEHLASRIDMMYANRIPVTAKVKLRFLLSCLEMAKRDGVKEKIQYNDLLALRNKVQRDEQQRQVLDILSRLGAWFGFPDDLADYLGLLDRALERCQQHSAEEFYFQDFAFYNVRVTSRWPWRRHETLNAVMYLFLFYLLTPVLFCVILDDKSVCPRDTTGKRPFHGWLTSLYFASTTMSTVGYGDVTIDKSSRWRIFIGILYIMNAVLVAILALSAAASASLTPLSRHLSRVVDKLTCNIRHHKGGLLHRRIFRTKCIIIAEVTAQFMILNGFGAFVLRQFLTSSQLEHQSWMLSFYWAVQTTTTVGYGDVKIPTDFRWFQVLYLSLSTYFVGNALGRLGNLKHELEELRLYYAWERRELSKAMIDDMKASSHDDKLDQYEFVVASLLTMRKISPQVVQRIMDKYRMLAGPSGYIDLSSVEEEGEEKSEVEASYEEGAWEECDRMS